MSATHLVLPFIFFSTALVLVGIAIKLSPKTSKIYTFLQREDGITTYFPLLASIGISFILTIVLKFIQG